MGVNPKDVMSSSVQSRLKTSRRFALETFHDLRMGTMTDRESEKAIAHLMSIYEQYVLLIDHCGCGSAHPCYTFAHRLYKLTKAFATRD